MVTVQIVIVTSLFENELNKQNMCSFVSFKAEASFSELYVPMAVSSFPT